MLCRKLGCFRRTRFLTYVANLCLPNFAIIRPPYKIQNPSEPQNTPRNTPQIPFQNRNTEKIRKIDENHPISYLFRIFFCISVLEGDLGCISGCILGFRGVLYFVWGTYDHNPNYHPGRNYYQCNSENKFFGTVTPYQPPNNSRSQIFRYR